MPTYTGTGTDEEGGVHCCLFRTGKQFSSAIRHQTRLIGGFDVPVSKKHQSLRALY